MATAAHEVIEGIDHAEYQRRWGRLAVGGLLLHRVPGSHLGIMRPPHVTELAEVLRARLSDPAGDVAGATA